MAKFHFTLILILLLSILNCSTATIVPDSLISELPEDPTFEERESFYFGGLMGKRFVNVNKACASKKVLQMQTQFTFTDVLLNIITIAIYSPKSVKIWCESAVPNL